MVNIRPQDGRDEHCQEREHRENRLGRLAHEAHVAVGHEQQDAESEQPVAQSAALLEVRREARNRHEEHDDILHDGDIVLCPERTGSRRCQRQVALQHVDGILLEGENRAVVEHAQQGDKPETAAREDLPQVADAEGVVLLLSLAGLRVQLSVHEEIDHTHDEGNAHQHHAESHRAGDVHMAAQTGKVGRENHAGGHAQTSQSHLRAHCQGHFPSLEPLDDAAAHRNAGHLHATAKHHEAAGSKLGRSRHILVEGRDTQLVEHRNIVQMSREPGLQAAAREAVAHGIPLHAGSHQHHHGREQHREAHTHLVQDNAREDEEESKHVEEHLTALHRAEGRGVPSARLLHQVLDGRKDVHEDVAAEHGQCQQQQRRPAHSRTVAQSLLNSLCHSSIWYCL